MEGLISDNGQLVDSQRPIVGFGNRAFAYGDGAFESMYVRHGEIPLWPYHVQRLLGAMRVYGLELSLSMNDLMHKIQELVEANGLCGKEARAKVVVYRSGGGLYAPATNLAGYAIGAYELKGKGLLDWQPIGLQVAPSGSVCLPSWGAGFKSLSAMDYVQAARECPLLGTDNVILCNEKGEICEAVGSNVWWQRAGVVYTPALHTGCVNGVFRRFLLQKLRESGIDCQETHATLDLLHGAEGAWLTNAVNGIQWVGKLDSEFLRPDKPLVIHELLKDWLFS
jgi:branched-chain amino acid aminotransferase